MAIRDQGAALRPDQKQAFVKQLLQSSLLGEVPAWPPYFLRSLLPLLPRAADAPWACGGSSLSHAGSDGAA